MKRLLWACLGVTLCLAALAGRGSAQGLDYSPPAKQCDDQPDHSLTLPGMADGPWCGCPRPVPTAESELEQRFRNWLLKLPPSRRRDLARDLLFGIQPALALVPPEFYTELTGDLPIPGYGRFRFLPVVLQEVCSNEIFNDLDEDVGLTGDIVLYEKRIAKADPTACGTVCPFKVARRVPPPPPWIEPPDVLTNLDRLLQADRLLRCGEELCCNGRLAEAVKCFEQVHRLVPGTNLEARAGAATQQVLVRVYGTADENGAADEQSEPAPAAPPAPACPECPRCQAGLCAKSKAPATVAESSRPHTVVYPVADLLGKGKQTRQDDLDDLADLIAASVSPKSWTGNGGEGTVDYYYHARALVVTQTPEVHEQIAELLAGLRQAKAQCDIEKPRPAPAPSPGRTAESDDEDDKSELFRPRTKPADHEAAPATKAKGCCDECSEGCCDECCPTLTLPAAPPADAKSGAGMRVEIEGCRAEGHAAGVCAGVPCCLHCAGFGLCTEADTAADGVRFRCQMPLGPLTLLVRFEHRQLTVGLGVSDAGATTEESESAR